MDLRIHNLLDAIKLTFRKDKELYRSFYNILGFYPHHIQYYQEAILHSSMAAKGAKGKPLNNERLEYLGDAVLEAVSSDILYRHFPHKQEGFLTNARSRIVQRETLGKVARDIGLDKLIRHHNTRQGHNSYLAGNAFEALIGAIYLDRGYALCQWFFEQRIIGHTINLEKTAYVEVNFKSRILELCQKNRLQLDFILLSEDRDEKGAPFFHSAVEIEGTQIGSGEGYSKRESQQVASKRALAQLKKDRALLLQLTEKAATRSCKPQPAEESAPDCNNPQPTEPPTADSNTQQDTPS